MLSTTTALTDTRASTTSACIYRGQSAQIIQLSRSNSNVTLPVSVNIDSIADTPLALTPRIVAIRRALRTSEALLTPSLAPADPHEHSSSDATSDAYSDDEPLPPSPPVRTVRTRPKHRGGDDPRPPLFLNSDSESPTWSWFEMAVHHYYDSSDASTDYSDSDGDIDTDTDASSDARTSPDTSPRSPPIPIPRVVFAHSSSSGSSLSQSRPRVRPPIRTRESMRTAATASVIGQTIRPPRIINATSKSSCMPRVVPPLPRHPAHARVASNASTTSSPRILTVIPGLTPRYCISTGTTTDTSALDTSVERLNDLYHPRTNVDTSAYSGAYTDEHTIQVTLLPAAKCGLVSIDDAPMSAARAVASSPLTLLSARTSPHLSPNASSASFNFSTALLYEAEISPTDRRDYIFESVAGGNYDSLAPTYDLRTCMRDSPCGSLHGGTHVSATVAAALAINLRGKCRLDVSLAPAFLYVMRRTRPNYGITTRECLRIALVHGCASMRAYEWTGDDDFAPEPRPDAMADAGLRRIIMYARVVSVAGLKLALHMCGAAIVLLPLYRGRPRFWCAEPQDVQSYRRGLCGVMSAVVCGYTQDGFMLTVWATGWLGDRVVILPWVDWDSVIECWITQPDVTSMELIGAPASALIPAAPSRAITPPLVVARADDKKQGAGCCATM